MRRLVIVFVAMGISTGLLARQQDREAQRLASAAQVVKTVMMMPGPRIPPQLVGRALCIGVIPSSLTIELGLGAHFGRGAMACRLNANKAWSPPWMFTVGGASYGLLPQGDSANVVFLVMTARCEHELMKGNMRLGKDATESSGPVAAKAGITSIALPQADILVYSISQGIFSGASLDNVVLKADGEANERLYGRRVTPAEILTQSKFQTPPAAKPLEEIISRFCSSPNQAPLSSH